MNFIVGKGQYKWIDRQGFEQEVENWQDIPQSIKELTAFIPDYPPEPHSEKDHAYIDSFIDKFEEVLSRCVTIGKTQ